MVIAVVLLCLGVMGILSFKQNAGLGKYVMKQGIVKKDNFEEKLRSNLVNDINGLGIPGVQVSVITKDKEYNFSVGTSDYDRRSEITNDNILRVGSITKLYTATIIMKLCEDGVLTLDTTIDRWFPDIHHSERITVGSLLNHTSGIYSYTENYTFLLKTIVSPKRIWEPDEIYLYILKGKPYFEPGEKHYYSNSNYLLLGMIIENVTGESYCSVLHEMILDPIKLKSTYFLPYEKSPVLLVTGFDRDVIPLGMHKIKPDNNVWASAGYSAGGIAANTGDISKFLKALFSSEILKSETLEKMTASQGFTDEDIPEQTGYGLGMRRIVVEDDTLFGHTGTIPGFGGAAFYCPEKDYCIALLGNVSYLKQTHLLRTVVKVINGQSWSK